MVTLPKSNRNVFVIGPSNQSYTREKCATISQGGSLYNARRKWPVRSSRSAPQVIGSPEDNVSLWQQMASKHMSSGAARVSKRVSLKMRPARNAVINAVSTNEIPIYVTLQPWIVAREGSVHQVAGGH